MLHRLLDGTRFGVSDDFTGDLDTTRWATTISDFGAATVNAGMNGLLSIVPSDGSAGDNDELYVYTNEIFLLKRQRPLYGYARLQFVEGAADQANIIFGFMSGVGENALRDDGGGPRQSGIFCGVYKIDRGRHWRAQSRDAFDFQDAVSTAPAGSVAVTEAIDGVVTTTTTYETLEVFIDDPAPPYTVNDRVMVATFRRNGWHLGPDNRTGLLTDASGAPIRHELSILSAVEMSLVVGVKNGAAVAELLTVDYLHGDQVRE